MAFGVTTNGFVRKTNEQILNDLLTAFQLAFGQDVDLSEDSPNTILNGLVAAMADISWQANENSYNSLNRNFASGVALDNAVALVGITRKGAAPSTAEVSFRGDPITLVPINTQVKQQNTNLVFQTLKEKIITSNTANLIQVLLVSVINNNEYEINISGNNYVYISSASATGDEIINGLKAAIEDAEDGIMVTNEGSNTMLIESIDKNDTYDFSVDNEFTILKVQDIIEVECLELGANPVNAGTINQLGESIAGIDSVVNYFDGQEGREIETDQELRLRTQQNIAVSGFSFVDAIRAKILDEVPGVSYCRVYENDTLVTDANGIPPKSWEAVIVGGSDLDIGNKIFELKIAGISTYGNTTVEVKSRDGTPYYVSFSRPSNLFIWVNVVVTSLNLEQELPINPELAIRNNILEYANTSFNIGEIIVTQKFFTPIYQVSGIGTATITIASTAGQQETPIYSPDNINCGIGQRPIFDLSRILTTIQ